MQMALQDMDLKNPVAFMCSYLYPSPPPLTFILSFTLTCTTHKTHTHNRHTHTDDTQAHTTRHTKGGVRMEEEGGTREKLEGRRYELRGRREEGGGRRKDLYSIFHSHMYHTQEHTHNRQ